MFGGSRRLTLSLILALSLLLAPIAAAQTAARDWSVFNTIASGSKLSVKLKTGKTVEGRLAGVSDDGLSLSVGGKQTDVKAAEVLKVYRLGGGSAKKETLTGLAVGAGAGAVVGVIGGDDDGFAPTRGQAAAGLAVLGGGVGALIGYAVGRGRHRRVLVYEAAERP